MFAVKHADSLESAAKKPVSTAALFKLHRKLQDAGLPVPGKYPKGGRPFFFIPKKDADVNLGAAIPRDKCSECKHVFALLHLAEGVCPMCAFDATYESSDEDEEVVEEEKEEHVKKTRRTADVVISTQLRVTARKSTGGVAPRPPGC